MVPKVIHRNTTGPHRAPCMAPKIGPSPAMFSSWIRNSFHWGMTTKSTPSLIATAGVSRSSGAKVLSTTLP